MTTTDRSYLTPSDRTLAASLAERVTVTADRERVVLSMSRSDANTFATAALIGRVGLDLDKYGWSYAVLRELCEILDPDPTDWS